MICPNPKCKSTDTARVGFRVANVHTGHCTVAAYWNVCKKCWHKWDGVTDGPSALPAGVVSRLSAQEAYLVSRGWIKPAGNGRLPQMWPDPVSGRESAIAVAVALQQNRDAGAGQ